MERIGGAIIGGGIIGCAVLRELAEAGLPDLFLFEKTPLLGEAQSGRNSGVVHAGIYYATGSLKAELCLQGNPLLYAFCREHGVPVENVGKLVVATAREEEPKLEAVFEQAKANGVPGVAMLTREQVKRFEPNVDVPSALHCPTTGIVDAAGLTRALARLAQVRGAQVLMQFEVTGIRPSGGAFEVTGNRGGREETFEAEIVVNAAGLYADRIARMVDPDFEAEIAPLRGEYTKFNRRKRGDLGMNGMNVYPVPETVDMGDREVGVVGVHLTPTFEMTPDGGARVGDIVTVGPEFTAVSDREDLETGHKGAAFFHQRAKRFFPGLRGEDLEMDFSGIMANLREGNDFIIRRDSKHPACVQLVGMDSPGMTCSLAIAKRVRRLLGV
ncbi:MAG: NAD(P)/FAD-dependent oxidoreductase [Planctomycetota bacterium]|jgi:L-2-hydroxyglutarate oxidase LhgO